ncbi:MAG: polyphosphate kinase 1 [Gammaproteobacteria bacterium]|nr:polyphosphate kinase 1 [Pseudomonadota bacterium]MCH9662026.1 polyphosphate kinase 1 [Gammaproteobacteria bacterium]
MSRQVTPQNRELSWLSFNERVLQEAADSSVRPISRLHFLGIVSSNLDDFYRVRVGSLNQALKSLPRRKVAEAEEIHTLLDAVRMRTLTMQERVTQALADIRNTLETDHNIFIVSNDQLNAKQLRWAHDYFASRIRPGLSVVTSCTRANLDRIIRSDWVYLAVRLQRKGSARKPQLAIVEIPTDTVDRFIALPDELCGENRHVHVWLDDIIRVGLGDVFAPFGYSGFDAYTIKLTRNAEMTMDNDIVANYIDRLSSKLKQRGFGGFVRLTYDAAMPEDLFRLLLTRVSLEKGANIIAGGRYHNFRDFSSFPTPTGMKNLTTPLLRPVVPREFQGVKRCFTAIEKQDVLLHYPYHSFDHLVNLMREASLDPDVERVSMTVYRVASSSEMMDALISALHNGKEVLVFMELKARFDEAANIAWVRRLEEAGAQVMTSINNYKVHSKLIHIQRRKGVDLAVVSTGNFNEKSARFYSDISVLTADKTINADVGRVFSFLQDPTQITAPKKLLMAPRNMRKQLMALINREIAAAKAGATASIKIKMNNVVDRHIVKALDKAARRGVRIDIVVRSTCSLNPDLPEYEGRMRILSIVDEYLEHARILIFANRGEPLIYISSADLMKRNLDHRIEVAVPLLSSHTRKQILKFFELHMSDNCKARIINARQDNPYQRTHDGRIRAQKATWDYLRSIS